MAFGGWGLCEGKGFILIGPGGWPGPMRREWVKCPWGGVGPMRTESFEWPWGGGGPMRREKVKFFWGGLCEWKGLNKV